MDQQPPITQAELVHELVSWEPCPPTPLTQPKATSTKRYSGLRFHCPTCRKTSGCHSSHRTHVKKQACSASPACDAEHAHHKIQLDFGSPVEALAWFHAQELDRFFAIESSRPKFQVYRCNQRASHQARPRKRTQKLQACSAKITFREALMCKCDPVAYQICPDEQTRTLVYGCLTHSHALEPHRTRWSKVTKERTLAWVREGLPVEAIIAESAALADQDPMQKPLSRSDIYRMAKTANLSGFFTGARFDLCRRFQANPREISTNRQFHEIKQLHPC
ncbi:uncharacterized protein LOC131880144 isoform X2 [Tigriopus californicus]|uniref:uncharacterized protein LOC131880144 isoform X2 n=1 Tax=Tigriopus californicus TaxID=6832 RepID=UPI0027DA58D7|nr:uncharacterized protein LOC131880144 isoform X2 [Tigriopus californicus]